MDTDKKVVLVIDGAYLLKGATKMQRDTRLALDQSDAGIQRMMDCIERAVRSKITGAYYFTGVRETNPRPNKYQNALKAAQVRVDLRPLKTMDVLCRDPNCNAARCPHKNNPILRETQAGTDVAIATKILTLVCEDALDVLFLLAGDGDFIEAVKFVTEVKHKTIWVAGFRGSLSQKLQEYATRGCVMWLDDVWEELGYHAPAGTWGRGDGGGYNNDAPRGRGRGGGGRGDFFHPRGRGEGRGGGDAGGGRRGPNPAPVSITPNAVVIVDDDEGEDGIPETVAGIAAMLEQNPVDVYRLYKEYHYDEDRLLAHYLGEEVKTPVKDPSNAWADGPPNLAPVSSAPPPYATTAPAPVPASAFPPMPAPAPAPVAAAPPAVAAPAKAAALASINLQGPLPPPVVVAPGAVVLPGALFPQMYPAMPPAKQAPLVPPLISETQDSFELVTLVDMGYDRAKAADALRRTNNNLDEALNLLI